MQAAASRERVDVSHRELLPSHSCAFQAIGDRTDESHSCDVDGQ